MAKQAQLPALAGLHLGKTGGTTLHVHVRDAVTDQWAYYQGGPHEDFRRVVKGQRLLAEFSPKKLAMVRFVFGHNLGLEQAFVLPEERLRLFTIIRDPFERFVSQYKHYIRYRRDSGPAVSARSFFEQFDTDQTARGLHRTFGSFVAGSEPSEAGTTELLGNLDYVLLTERLDRQGSELMALIGLPPLDERHRVYPETPELGGLDRAEVEAANPIDTAIVARLREADPALGNPFAHDREGRRRMRTEIDGAGDKVERAYRTVFDYMRRNRLLRVALAAAEVRQASTLSTRIDHYLAEEAIDLGGPLSVREELRLGEVLTMLKQLDRAAQHYERVIEQEPTNFVAHLNLARLLQSKDRERALGLCRRALELNATNQEARKLHDRLTS